MYTLEGKNLRFSVDGLGRVVSFYSKVSRHEYVKIPGQLWKMIYSEGIRAERPVFSEGQPFTADIEGEIMTLTYDRPRSDDRTLELTLTLIFSMSADGMTVEANLENRGDVTVDELSITAASGIQSLSGRHEDDYIMWPALLGTKVTDPAFRDLSLMSGFRKYERHDQLHTDLERIYPGRGCMQWYDYTNGLEGLYVGSHDKTQQTVLLHVERDVRTNTLSMGVVKYPFCEKGERYHAEPIVYSAHEGDWHAGARIYRRWIEGCGLWKAPECPQWMKDFEGFLRVILKPHHCEINWNYSQIPALFDEAQAAGLDTIFLLGWEKGGFARMWPDFEVDDDMGGEAGLKKAVDYVHSKGGKVIFFLSYFLIDHKSDFYLNENGDECTMKSIWGEDIPFAETYCGEGTYRKIPNPPMPMYGACPGSRKWHEKMKSLAGYCLDRGADGVLYDLGGLMPYFCFAKGHDHDKPNYSHATKAANFADLRAYIKSRGDDKVIYMEHTVDTFNQHMDLAQSSAVKIKQPQTAPEMYRYTFPELNITNRELGQDEENYRDKINFTFLYGLAFDMTIFRCCGTLSDIPNYTAYMSEIIALRKKYKKFLHYGRFTDNEGFTLSAPGANVAAKSYRAADGSLGVALWNMGKIAAAVIVTFADSGKTASLTVAPDSVAVCE